MATLHKRSYKLQEFVAHHANINCLSLGRKSGRVMVTGGDDKKVNLWAVGKQRCFMSLCGHASPIECVQFNHAEEAVIAGSRSGAIKVWDLEAAKLIRTLVGHTDSVRCIDFHPYGEYLASGSADCHVKFWDSRRKGCLFSYLGHKRRVNSLKFSPDGHWIASGGDDCSLKIWDVRVGKVLREFHDHVGSVTSVRFHPHEFLLATGGADCAVNFFDLESFALVSSEANVGSVRCMAFSPGGECLFAGVRDHLKVVGWEPSKLYDTEAVLWGHVCDISTTQNQLVAASCHLNTVAVYLVDLAKVRPLGRTNDASNPFTPNQSIRRSFSKAQEPVGLRNKSSSTIEKTIEESTSGTDPEEDSTADITNLKDYNEIFRGRSLQRTPPPIETNVFGNNGLDVSPVQRPPPSIDTNTFANNGLDVSPVQRISSPIETNIFGNNGLDVSPVVTEPQILSDWDTSAHPVSLDDRINCPPSPRQVKHPISPYVRSKSNLDQVFVSTKLAIPLDKDQIKGNRPKPQQQQQQQGPRHLIQRQHSREEKNHRNNNNAIKHSASEANISKSSSGNVLRPPTNHVRKNSFSKTPRLNNVTNVNASKIPSNSNKGERNVSKSSPDDDSPGNENDFIPMPVDKPVGLNLDDFLPKSPQTLGMHQQVPDMSETEVLGSILRGHEPMMAVFKGRQRKLQVVLSKYRNKDIKAAFENALSFNDLALIVDVLGVFNQKYTQWNLDLCVLVLPKVEELLQSKYENYVTRGCDSLKLILRHFGSVIKTNISNPVGSFGVDIPREERYRKSLKCHDSFMSIMLVLGKKLSVPGAVGSTIKEIYTQIKSQFI